METEIMHMTFMQYVNFFMQQNMTMVVVTFCLILLDIISGVIQAWYNHEFSSKVFKKGLLSKLGYIIVMCVVAILQVAMFDDNFSVGFDFPLFDVVCAFIILLEVSSIVENACLINPDLEKFIGKYFNLTGKEEAEKIEVIDDGFTPVVFEEYKKGGTQNYDDEFGKAITGEIKIENTD